MRWLKRLGRFALDYLDLLIAAAMAVAFTALGALNHLKGDALTQAAIGLLGVLGFVIFRERVERRKAVEGIDRAVESIGAAKPWQVLQEDLTWDIRSPESATCVSERDVRFLGAEVFTIYEFERGTTGRVTQRICKGAARGDALRPLHILQSFVGPDGLLYQLISLEEVRRRGDRMDLRYERQLTGSFLGDRENVSKEVQFETDRLVMRIGWPATKPPATVRLERTNRPSETVDTKSRKGRVTLEKTIDNPRIGEVINISWTW